MLSGLPCHNSRNKSRSTGLSLDRKLKLKIASRIYHTDFLKKKFTTEDRYIIPRKIIN
jgi:hypothetical protein